VCHSRFLSDAYSYGSPSGSGNGVDRRGAFMQVQTKRNPPDEIVREADTNTPTAIMMSPHHSTPGTEGMPRRDRLATATTIRGAAVGERRVGTRSDLPDSGGGEVDTISALRSDAVAAWPHRKSINTMSELSRKRSNTICLPSGLTSKVRMPPLSARRVNNRLFQVRRSSSQKFCVGASPCI
jgi:hypothetical protein